ncbi:PTI1-like tyrosine-protein kinase [Platanthera zijinensis]|uniref:PTI1-like tyrosine-protein kinase n=1 Tax=Platanthera zijinensis TaxID=2320716 RepID=A0AAP0AVZ7_9ASPA
MVSSCCGEEKAPAKRINGGTPESTTWRLFTYKELHVATNGFSEDYKLGEGGFGSVYWGKTTDGNQVIYASLKFLEAAGSVRLGGIDVSKLELKTIFNSNSRPASNSIAVKKLKAMNSKAEMEFAIEVEILGRVRHKNLLGLRGYCAGAEQRLIVYDYMPNLSLLSHLHGQFTTDMQLDWKKRMNIITGSARGLVYLHHEATPHIIHRDIKASNVLLDSNFEPLVADFGFAKLMPDGVSHMTTRVKGTLGYLAPEYAMWGKVSESCDVYSFGILLLELVSGKKPIEKLAGGVKRTITEWAEPLISAGRLAELVDSRLQPYLQGEFDNQQLHRIIYAAARCVHSEPDRRPSMLQVLDIVLGTSADADPAKGARLSNATDGDGQSTGRSSTSGTLRMKSIKYGKELMAMDDEDSHDGDNECEEEDGDREVTSYSSGDGGNGDSSKVYGVFGALEAQKMRDNYGQYSAGHKRTALRG